jgi:Na+-transporting NADH:ubiquinone oxidoreductase subunit A
MIPHKIRKGFDLPLAGAAERRLEDAPPPSIIGIEPTEFAGIKAKLCPDGDGLLHEGSRVQTGQPLFYDKRNPSNQWVAPATGEVVKVQFGARRVLERIEIRCEEDVHYADMPRVAEDALGSTPREKLIEALQGAGLWPLIRQRPVGKIADPARTPVAIYVGGLDTEPLAADPAFAVQGHGKDLQAGCDLLRALTDGPVHFVVAPGEQPSEFQGLQGVDMRSFEGPHPAGLVGTWIHEIRPLKSGETAWYLKAQEVVLLGAWLRTGHYPVERVVAVAGSSMPQPRYLRTRQGAPLATLTGGEPLGEDVRVINGTVLSGAAEPGDGYLGFRATTVTAIPEGANDRELFGWALPQPKRIGFHRATFPFLGGGNKVVADARLNGGHRAIVNLGAWEAVTPLDILPTFLVRAIQAGDLDEALKLGLLEVTEEDLALCTVVDPCKIDVGAIIRQGLDLYEREG